MKAGPGRYRGRLLRCAGLGGSRRRIPFVRQMLHGLGGLLLRCCFLLLGLAPLFGLGLGLFLCAYALARFLGLGLYALRFGGLVIGNT